MAQNWTLTIDIRATATWGEVSRKHGQYRRAADDRLAVVLVLYDEHRRRRNRKVHAINTDVFLGIMSNLRECFREEAQRGTSIWDWGRDAGNWLELAEALDVGGIATTDGLTIETAVTAIPWDLVHVGGEPLANRMPLGLSIPSEGRPVRRKRVPDNSPRFLHVICDPLETLSLDSETTALEAMATQVGVHYQQLENPTVTDLIAELNKERATPFFHFSGHITRRGELLLADRSMRPDEIRKGARLSDGAVVFLNACDDLFGEDAADEAQDPYSVDLFKPASVANAFHDAGAGAVIAPRTLLDDADAAQAAEAIWGPAFAGESLGAAVHTYRRSKGEANRNSRAAYSFILYGEPQYRLDWKRPGAAAREEPAAAAVGDAMLPIVQAAARFAAGEVAPKHVLGALTYSWIVAQSYFEIERQAYISPLHQLRHAVSDRSGTGRASAAAPTLDPLTRKLLARVRERSGGSAPDELSILEALADLGDPYVDHALMSLGTGPRSIAGVLEVAREWRASGSTVPATVFGVAGDANPALFLPELAASAREEARHADASIGSFEILIGLLQVQSNSASVWASRDMPALRTDTWRPGRALRWGDLNAESRASVLTAMREGELESCEVLKESYLVYGILAPPCELHWHCLSPAQQQVLTAAHVERSRWEEILTVLRRQQTVWA